MTTTTLIVDDDYIVQKAINLFNWLGEKQPLFKNEMLKFAEVLSNPKVPLAAKSGLLKFWITNFLRGLWDPVKKEVVRNADTVWADSVREKLGAVLPPGGLSEEKFTSFKDWPTEDREKFYNYLDLFCRYYLAPETLSKSI